MPTDTALVELRADAALAMRDLQLIAASLRELVERAEGDRLTTGVRLELVPDMIARAAAVQRFLIELAPLVTIARLVDEAVAA